VPGAAGKGGDALPASGGMVFGRIAASQAEEQAGARLWFEDVGGAEIEALYTDETGAARAEPGAGTSVDGAFAAFGLAPGPLRVRVQGEDGELRDGDFVTRVEAGAVTSLHAFVLR
jgi:hypothetical protein